METLICRNCGPIEDYYTELKSGQNTAWCSKCDAFIKNIPYSTAAPTFYFGKYKGKLVTEVEDMPYLKWVLDDIKPKPKMKQAIEAHIANFENLAR